MVIYSWQLELAAFMMSTEVIAMVVTIEQLHEMLGRIEQELAEARTAMAELSRTQNKDTDTFWQLRMKQVHERNRQLQPAMNQVCEIMGINAPSVSAEEVQQMMLTEGVAPEANLGSSGILEMREE
jgi:hypothetical protein